MSILLMVVVADCFDAGVIEEFCATLFPLRKDEVLLAPF